MDKTLLQRQSTQIERSWLLEAAPRSELIRQKVGFSAVIVLLLLAAWLGARGLNADAFWYDEVWSLYYAGGAESGPISPFETIERVAAQLQHEKNPPGYYVALNLWGSLTGWSEFAGRTLSWLAGMLTVALTYRLGYDVAAEYSARSRRLIGLGAAVTVGCSAFFVYYSHELRAYVPSMMFTTFVVWAYWRILTTKSKPSKTLQTGLVMAATTALYTHYLTALLLVTLGLYHLLIAPKNRRWMRLTLLALASGALFLPCLGSLLVAAAGAEDLNAFALPLTQLLDSLGYAFSNGSLAFVGLLTAFATQAHGRAARAIWFLGVAGLVVAVILNSVYPVITQVRYLIVLWPLLGLVVGLGIERLMQKGIPVWLLLGIWTTAGLWNTFDPNFNRNLSAMLVPMPWREFQTELQTFGQADDVVVVHAPQFNWFRELEIQHYMTGLPMRHTLLEQIPGVQDEEFLAAAESYVGDAPRLWLGVDNTFAPSFRLFDFQRLLADDYVQCLSALDSRDMSMNLYARIPGETGAMPFQFGNGIGMQLADSVRTLPDGTISVMLGWQVETEVPSNTYSVGLHVVDETGNLVAQADYALPLSGYSCLPTSIPVRAGTYTVMALVYNWQTGERLPGIDRATGESFDRIPIATIAVK
jgi:4-amino-4-deoxy-L-arabinose transferase-like glycosyltransferase